MTYRQKYSNSKSWQERATIMNLFHVLKKSTIPKWKLDDTAAYFYCSIGLVSQNLQLANRIEELRSCKTRREALAKLQEIK